MASISASSFKPRTRAFKPCSFITGAASRGVARCLRAADISTNSRKLPSSSSRITYRLTKFSEFTQIPWPGHIAAPPRSDGTEGIGSCLLNFSLYCFKKCLNSIGISCIRTRAVAPESKGRFKFCNKRSSLKRPRFSLLPALPRLSPQALARPRRLSVARLGANTGDPAKRVAALPASAGSFPRVPVEKNRALIC